LKAPDHILLDDESIHFFQAKAMLRGDLIFFDRTNPYLFPLTLSIFSNLPLIFLRIVPVFFMSLAVSVYFRLLQKNTDNIVAFFASCLLAFHSRIIEYAIQLYSEGLLLLLLFLSIDKLLDILGGKTSWKNFMLLGLYMGLSLETKPLIPIVPFFFVGWILLRTKGAYKVQTGVAALLSIFLYLPYFLINGVTYLRDKFCPIFNIGEIIRRMSFSIDHFGIIFTIFLCVAIVNLLKKDFSQQKDVFKVFITFGILYVFFIVFVVFGSMPKYFLLCLPAGTLLIAQFIFYKSIKNNTKFYFVSIYFILFLFSLLSSLRWIPAYDRNVHFLPGYNGRQLELENTRQTYLYKNIPRLLDYKPNIAKAVDMREQNKSVQLKLPILDQDNYTIAKYEFDFYVPSKSFRFIFFSHISDKVRVLMDGKELTRDWAASTFFPFQINLNRALDIGFHQLTLYIFNETNIGGIGQVLFFEKDVTKILRLASVVENGNIGP
jgi:hypothetical protein